MNQLFIPIKICNVFGNGFGDRFGLRISLMLVLVGLFGLYIEIINAFEYVQGARKGYEILTSQIVLAHFK